MGACSSKNKSTHIKKCNSPIHSPNLHNKFCTPPQLEIIEDYNHYLKTVFPSYFDIDYKRNNDSITYEYKHKNYTITNKKSGFNVVFNNKTDSKQQNWFIFNLHCGELSEFVCLIKDKPDTIEYGNGSRCITSLYSMDKASVILWRCTKCRVGFASNLNKL